MIDGGKELHTELHMAPCSRSARVNVRPAMRGMIGTIGRRMPASQSKPSDTHRADRFTDTARRSRLTAGGRDLEFRYDRPLPRARKVDRHVRRRRRRYRDASQGVEGRQSWRRCGRTSSRIGRRRRRSRVYLVGVGEDPPVDRRRDHGRLAGGDRAARAAARSAAANATRTSSRPRRRSPPTSRSCCRARRRARTATP